MINSQGVSFRIIFNEEDLCWKCLGEFVETILKIFKQQWKINYKLFWIYQQRSSLVSFLFYKAIWDCLQKMLMFHNPQVMNVQAIQICKCIYLLDEVAIVFHIGSSISYKNQDENALKVLFNFFFLWELFQTILLMVA